MTRGARYGTIRWALGVLCLALVILLVRAPSIEFYLNSTDHGYQLAFGRQVVLGLFPGIDVFMNYGPLVAFTSAAGIWLSGSLLGETLLCACGYAISLALIGALARRYVSALAGVVGPVLALLLIARFYKWYYWLFPLLALAGTLSVLETTEPRRRLRRAFATGLLCSVGGLYRPDFMIMLPFGVGLGFVIAQERSMRRGDERALAIAYLTGFLLPLGIWVAVLSLRAGSPRAVLDWASYVVSSSQAKVLDYSLPFPRPRRSDARETGTLLLFVLAVLTHVAGLVVGWRLRRASDAVHRERANLMLVGSAIGLGVFAQACHRSDLGHLLQVLPPAILVGLALVSAASQQPSPATRGSAVRLYPMVASTYVILTGLAVVAVWPALTGDLAHDGSRLLTRYRALRLLPDALPDHPYLSLASKVHALTRPDERVLVIPSICNLYFFIERPLSGFRIHFLYRESDAWVAREQAAIQQHPPAVVLAYRSFVDAPGSSEFDRSQPGAAAYIRAHYVRLTDAGADWVMLTREAGAG
jgi:hypothetical protein